MKCFRMFRCRQLLPRCLVAGLLAAPGLGAAGTVKVAANLAGTHYFNQQNTFANVLLNCTGFGGTRGVNLTADGVSKRPGASAWYSYHPKLTPGMWLDGSDDPATWYKLTYHCDVDVKRNFVSFQGFKVAKQPVSDGQGNWTGWLRFRAGDVQGDRIAVIVNYASDDLDATGLARHPISQLKVLQPGSTDDDFLSPAFKKAHDRFRPLPLHRSAEHERPGGRFRPGRARHEEHLRARERRVLRARLSGQAQTQTYCNGMDLNLSWGKGLGKGNHMKVWNGTKYDEAKLGIGCLAPCEMEYDLGGRFLLFYTTVGIDHEVDQGGDGGHPLAGRGNVTFQVWAAAVPNPGPRDYQLLREIRT